MPTFFCEKFCILYVLSKGYVENKGFLARNFSLIAETELPYSTKERIALLISLENNCKMCVDVHKGIAKMLGMTEEQIKEVLDGVDGIQCADSEKVLLRFCIRASQKDNYKMLQKDIDQVRESGYTDSQIIEAVAITGYFNYINTLSNVFGLGK